MKTGVGCHALLQGSSRPRDGTHMSSCLLHWQAGSFPLAPPSGETNLEKQEGRVLSARGREGSLSQTLGASVQMGGRQNVDSEAGSKGALLDCFSSFSLKSQVRLMVEASVSGREA